VELVTVETPAAAAPKLTAVIVEIAVLLLSPD
jgi:hypothetical protein